IKRESMSLIFDSERACLHTRALCYPRRVGTPRERRAAQHIWRAFTQSGLACERESFRVSHFCAEIGSRLVLVLSALCIMAGVLLISIQPTVAALCWFMAALAVNSPWRLRTRIGTSWRPWTTSSNVLGTLRKSPTEAPARVIFMAHYDTKSQLLPTGVRVALIASVTALCGAGAILTRLAALDVLLLPAGGGWTAASSLFLLVILVANVSGNRSP